MLQSSSSTSGQARAGVSKPISKVGSQKSPAVTGFGQGKGNVLLEELGRLVDLEVRDSLKVTDIAGQEREIKRPGGCRNQEVHVRDNIAAASKPRPSFREG